MTSLLGVNVPIPSGSSLLSGAGTLALVFFFFIIIGGCIGAIFFVKTQKKKFNNIIKTYREVNGQLAETIPDFDLASIVTIPNTSVQVFYLKRFKIYLPIGTRRMGMNKFYYAIRNNNEWVNFDLGSLEKVIAEKGLNYDAQDMRYGNANLKRIIDRSFKNEKWWQVYRNELGMAFLILMLGVVFFILIGQVNKGISAANSNTATWNSISDHLDKILSGLNNICSTSGARPVALVTSLISPGGLV